MAATVLLTELLQFLKEEAILLRGVEEDIEYIMKELEIIRAFLIAAHPKEDDDPMLDAWVEQVRDVAHEIEDAIIGFLQGIAPRRQYSCTCLRASDTIFFSIIRKWKVHHQIGAKLRSIKAKLIDVSERPKRYGYTPPKDLYSISNKSDTVEQGSKPTLEIDRSKALVVRESKLGDISKPKSRITNWLLTEESEPNNRKVLAIFGTGGMGKTKLVQNIYDDVIKVKSKFHSHAFVTVSRWFDLEELLRDIILKLLHPKNKKRMVKLPVEQDEEIDAMDTGELKESVKKLLQSEKYLIVLDDVRREEHWKQIKYAIPDNKHGSRIVITTRMGMAEVISYSKDEFQATVGIMYRKRSRQYLMSPREQFSQAKPEA